MGSIHNLHDVLDMQILGLVAFQVYLHTLTVEGVGTWEHVELFVKNCSKTDVTRLTRVDCNVFVTHAPLLVSQLLSTLRMTFNLFSQSLNFLLIVVQTLAQMLFHVLNFSILRKHMQNILNFKDITLLDDLQSLFNVNISFLSLLHCKVGLERVKFRVR